MKTVNIISTADPAWDVLIKRLPHDVYHLAAYLRAEDAYRGDSSQLVVVEDLDATLALPLTFREVPGGGGIDASSPYGYPAPVVTGNVSDSWMVAAIEALISYLRAQNAISLFIRFHPLMGVDPKHFAQFGVRVDHGETVSVRLGRPFDEIRSDMRKGHRYDIKKSMKNGQSPEWDPEWNHFEEFLNIYRQTMDRVGAGPDYYFSREYFEHLKNDLGETVSLWVTKIDNSVAAASLFTECNGIVQYHLSGTHTNYLSAHPTKVLLDAVASWANERGNVSFHLGGGVGSRQDSLFNFKAGFSKERHVFTTVRVIVDPLRYREVVARWEGQHGRTADEPHEFFPAYRR